MADTARAIEIRLNQVVMMPDQTCWWRYLVMFIDLGGTIPHSLTQGVLVESSTPTFAPSLQVRAAAYRAFAAGVVGAVNTIPTTVLGTEHLVTERA